MFGIIRNASAASMLAVYQFADIPHVRIATYQDCQKLSTRQNYQKPARARYRAESIVATFVNCQNCKKPARARAVMDYVAGRAGPPSLRRVLRPINAGHRNLNMLTSARRVMHIYIYIRAFKCMYCQFHCNMPSTIAPTWLSPL